MTLGREDSPLSVAGTGHRRNETRNLLPRAPGACSGAPGSPVTVQCNMTRHTRILESSMGYGFGTHSAVKKASNAGRARARKQDSADHDTSAAASRNRDRAPACTQNDAGSAPQGRDTIAGTRAAFTSLWGEHLLQLPPAGHFGAPFFSRATRGPPHTRTKFSRASPRWRHRGRAHRAVAARWRCPPRPAPTTRARSPRTAPRASVAWAPSSAWRA
jgi:hypothetical protein